MKFLISFIVGILLGFGLLVVWFNVKAENVKTGVSVSLTAENCLTTIKNCKCN